MEACDTYRTREKEHDWSPTDWHESNGNDKIACLEDYSFAYYHRFMINPY